MPTSQRRLEELDPIELRRVLADRNNAFRAMLEHEQRSLTPTILGALGIAAAIIISTSVILFLLNVYVH